MVWRHHREGGGLGLLGPTSLVMRRTLGIERPVPRELENWEYSSSTAFLWYWMLWKSAQCDQYDSFATEVVAHTDVPTLRLWRLLLVLLLLQDALAVFDVV